MLTTPDYPPQIGGLASFSQNLMGLLQQLGTSVELCIWPDQKDKLLNLMEYDLLINVHCGIYKYIKWDTPKTINFIHGTEITFSDANYLKHWVKKLLKAKCYRYLNKSYLNLIISEYTANKLRKNGYNYSHARDIIFPNCINVDGSTFIAKEIKESIHVSFLARDVPHKNSKGILNFCEEFQKSSQKKVILHTTCQSLIKSDQVDVISYTSLSPENVNEIYKKVHLNLLLSLDHSFKGHFEGFGLVVLEAGIWGVPSVVTTSGGQVEAVHDKMTGWHLKKIDSECIHKLWEDIKLNYSDICEQCYQHSINFHSNLNYKKLLRKIIQSAK